MTTTYARIGPIEETKTDTDERTTSGLLLEVSLTDVARDQRAAALTTRLRDAIRSGRLPTGSRLPATRTLASDLGVSRGVVVRTYEQLVAEGYLDARGGSGTRVAGQADRPAPAPPPSHRPAGNPGLPAGAHFPRAAWGRAAARALADLPDVDFGYGDPAGLPRLRRELSAYLGRVRAAAAPPDRIVVTNGFAQGGRLLAEVLLRRGVDRIGVEDPGSVGLREQLGRLGLTCVPVPVDGAGLRVDALAATGVRAVVTTPAHQFPTGVVLDPHRRHELLEWAGRTGGLVVEDDYDAEFRYDRAPVGCLQGLGAEHVVLGGSLSKTLAPALRQGWLVVPEPLVGAFAAAKYDTDLATGVLEQATFAAFLAAGDLDRHVRRMAVRYRRARDRLVAALHETLPDWHVSGTAAGLHLLLRPPATADEEHLVALAREAGLDARPLGAYAVTGPLPPGLVIGYGHRSPATLEAAVGRLQRLLSDRP